MSALQTIVAEAKRLKRLYPNRFNKWSEYISLASKSYKSKTPAKIGLIQKIKFNKKNLDRTQQFYLHKGKKYEIQQDQDGAPYLRIANKTVYFSHVQKISGTKKCTHKKCAKCGGIKNYKIGASVSDLCSPKCLMASRNACECKCGGKYHGGTNQNKLNSKIGALPINFSGAFLGYKFSVYNQYRIDGGVTAVLLDTGKNKIAELNGVKAEEERAANALYTNSIAHYKEYLDAKDTKHLKDRIKKFVTQLNGEVKDYNSGKNTKTKKQKPVVYSPSVKKLSLLHEIKTLLKENKKILVRGYKIKPGKIREKISGSFHNRIAGLFDTSVIKDIDTLKRQYFQLAKKYHPDAGGTTVQFQNLQAEYDKLFKSLVNGSSLSSDEKNNEIVIDKAIRDIIDQIITLPELTIEVVGKWLWVSGNTYPVYQTLKSVGLSFVKKAGVPYWVYKGVESSGRGKMSMEEIKTKYGVHKFNLKDTGGKRISGMKLINKVKLKAALLRLKAGLNKRPI